MEKELVFSLSGRLASGLIHEIRNRLQSLESTRGLLDANWKELTEKKNPIYDYKFISEFSNDLTKMRNYTKNMSDLTYLFSSLIKRWGDTSLPVVEIIKKYTAMLQPAAKSNDVHIVIELPERDILKSITFPSIVLGQILTNLVLNSIHHNDKAYGLVKISLDYFPEQELPIIITVEDTGKGIHRKDYKKIFEPFVTTKVKDGVGLGLYIVYNLALNNGIAIELKSSYMYSGTIFQIKIPLILGQ
ncbi:sensor histidine kinase [Candidatus Magnetomonas plexicatena]|uniref:sensor histidine kinase n=1 Tax=Candidatus Magnetomonas plexicatena TaxID=2552947 RepID=UPI001101CBFA|nr:HAMP domain-containing histidine kinase [Nitrospirales bacterium LBB_01]